MKNSNEVRRAMRYIESVVDRVNREGGHVYNLWGQDYSLREVQTMRDCLLEVYFNLKTVENERKYARLVEIIEEMAENEIDWWIYDESVMLETVKQHIPNVSELEEEDLEEEAYGNLEYILEDYKSFQEKDEDDEEDDEELI